MTGMSRYFAVSDTEYINLDQIDFVIDTGSQINVGLSSPVQLPGNPIKDPDKMKALRIILGLPAR